MAQLMRTLNPVLNGKRFEGVAEFGGGMTLEGTVNKTGLLLLLAIASAAWTWHLFNLEHSAAAVLPGCGSGSSADSSAQWSQSSRRNGPR